MAAGFEAFHDGGVVSNAVSFFIGMELRLKDYVIVAVVGDHNVLIAAARANEEVANVVRV